MLSMVIVVFIGGMVVGRIISIISNFTINHHKDDRLTALVESLMKDPK